MRKEYKYYSIMRPVMPLTFPKEGLIDFENYDSRQYVEEIERRAWAELWYDRELTEQELIDYEFEPSPINDA